MAIENIRHYVYNGAGWELALRHRFSRDRMKKNRRPIAIVPGFGMNSHIFSYHPNSLSLEEYLAENGFEVWSMDLRNQGASRRVDCQKGMVKEYGLRDLAMVDLAAALDYISVNTMTCEGSGKVDTIGCSLAGSIICIYIVMNKHHRVGTLVSLGAPLRWVEVPPFVKIAFSSPLLMKHLKFKKSRELAAALLPVAAKFPAFLDIYMHGTHVDLTHAADFAKTVEDPVPKINLQIARWIKNVDLVIDGVNICKGLKSFTNPTLAVVANSDGIVPAATAAEILNLVGSKVKGRIDVGTDELKFAHADLYVSNHAEKLHFAPVAAWLKELYRQAKRERKAKKKGA